MNMNKNKPAEFTYMEIGKIRLDGPLTWEMKKTFIRKIYAPMLTVRPGLRVKKKES